MGNLKDVPDVRSPALDLAFCDFCAKRFDGPVYFCGRNDYIQSCKSCYNRFKEVCTRKPSSQSSFSTKIQLGCVYVMIGWIIYVIISFILPFFR